MRKLTVNRWNYSQNADKWVYVSLTHSGRRKYKYQTDPPEEFVKLSMELRELNKIQARTKDPTENMRIFDKMRAISEKMQSMTEDGI